MSHLLGQFCCQVQAIDGVGIVVGCYKVWDGIVQKPEDCLQMIVKHLIALDITMLFWKLQKLKPSIHLIWGQTPDSLLQFSPLLGHYQEAASDHKEECLFLTFLFYISICVSGLWMCALFCPYTLLFVIS
jgi:hypothetical protein